MSILDDIAAIGNTNVISGISNILQIYDATADSIDLSNGQQLRKIVESLNEQDKKYSETILRYCERLILDNEKLKLQNNEILKTQQQILNILQQKGGI